MKKNILIVGFGLSGKDLAKYYLSNSVKPCVLEENLNEEKMRLASSLGVDIFSDINELKSSIDKFDQIIVSPGVAPSHPIFSYSSTHEILGEIEVAFEVAKAPIIAVTGTNGKSSVVSAVSSILTRAGYRVSLCGNIGTSFISEAQRSDVDYFVVEVSSFQLFSIRRFKPYIALILNIKEDHLNWHGSFEAYKKAKGRIFSNLDLDSFAIGFSEDYNVVDLLESSHGNKLTFGFYSGDYRVERSSIVGKDIAIPIDTTKFKRRSKVDIINATASACVAKTVSVEDDVIEGALAEFPGLKHRQEEFLNHEGVLYINDSKSTTPASTIWALKDKKNVILIAGGRNKGLNLSELLEAKDSLKALVAFGESKNELYQIFKKMCPELTVKKADSIKEAVSFSCLLAKPGDTVMLSPACASFDLYNSFEERGDDFKSCVKKELKLNV